MSFDVSFAPSRYLVLAGCLILALSWHSSAIAENTFVGVIPDRSLRFPDVLQPEEKGDLTLRDAALLALQRNPELASFAKEMRALEGATLQAGLLRNPELSINVENAGNIQPLQGDVNSQKAVTQEVVQQITTIRISQLIELGGKRAARVNAALLGEELAGKDYETRRVETFTEVLAGQERVRLAEDNLQLAQGVVSTTGKRVQAGKVPPIEETRAGVTLSTTRIELEQAQRDLVSARKRLTLLWGNASPRFIRALGNLELLITLPSFEVLAERVLSSPIALRAMKNIEQRKALLEVEQTRRIPNLTVNAGVVHHALLGGNTPVVSLVMPLPFFDRNQGNVREAHQRVNKAIDEQAAVDLRLKAELTLAYEALSSAQNEVGILRDEILPAAKSAFEITNRGYELGKFGFLEVLDAQRTLFQNRILYVRALANYHRLVNEIERVIAAPIDGAVNPAVINGHNTNGTNGANGDSRSTL